MIVVAGGLGMIGAHTARALVDLGHDVVTAHRRTEPPPLHADDGGDSCCAPDAGRATALLTTARTLRHDTDDVSDGWPSTHRELVDAVAAAVPGARLDLLPGRRNGPGADSRLDTTRLVHDTGFTPASDITTAVAHHVAWRADDPR